MQNAESCQRVICRESSAEHSANYLSSFFRIQQPKNSAFPQITKLSFARIVQQMCNRCIAVSRGPFLPYSLWSVCQAFNSCDTGWDRWQLQSQLQLQPITAMIAFASCKHRVRGLTKPQVASILRLSSRMLSCLYTSLRPPTCIIHRGAIFWGHDLALI